jgi:hypothetical protein
MMAVGSAMMLQRTVDGVGPGLLVFSILDVGSSVQIVK